MGGSEELRSKIHAYLLRWNSSAPTRSTLEEAVDEIRMWQNLNGRVALWKEPPLLITATLDDGWGHGIELIRRFAEAAGVTVFPLGLLQNVETIVTACHTKKPNLLGLTVLQFDTEEQLVAISQNKPKGTRIVAGGPVFSADPDFARRSGVDFVAGSAADFWRFLLGYSFQE